MGIFDDVFTPKPHKGKKTGGIDYGRTHEPVSTGGIGHGKRHKGKTVGGIKYKSAIPQLKKPKVPKPQKPKIPISQRYQTVKRKAEAVGSFWSGGVGTKKEQAKRRKANVKTTKRMFKKVRKRLLW